MLPEKRAPIIFLEEGMKNGGAAMNIYERLRDDKKMDGRRYRIRAIEDFAVSEKERSLYETCSLDANSLIYNIKEEFFSKN
jgi:deoxyxylulose-5-phosphate synthase